MRVPLWGRGASPSKVVHLPYLNPRAILHPRPPTSYLGAHHRKGTKESYETQQPDQLSSHPGPARPPGHRHAPPPHLPFLPGDGRSIDYTRHTRLLGHSRVCATLMAHSPPATGQGDDPTPSGPRRPSRPGSTPPSLPSELPFPRRREGGYARPPPNGRKRLGFIPLSGLPRLTSRRPLFTQRRQRVRAPIPPNGRASPAYGQAARGNSL